MRDGGSLRGSVADGAEPAIAGNDSWIYEHTVEIGQQFSQTRQEVTVMHTSG